MKKLNVYYAHSKNIYNTSREKSELKWLRKQFKFVICPNNDMGELGSMEPYLQEVENNDAVVCSEYKGYIGRGVTSEVNTALSLNYKVWVLRKILGKFYLKTVKGSEIFDSNDWRYRYAKLILGKTKHKEREVSIDEQQMDTFGNGNLQEYGDN